MLSRPVRTVAVEVTMEVGEDADEMMGVDMVFRVCEGMTDGRSETSAVTEDCGGETMIELSLNGVYFRLMTFCFYLLVFSVVIFQRAWFTIFHTLIINNNSR